MRKLLLFVVLCLSWMNLFAQYEMKAMAPLNPDIRQGKLPNGLTYYVCKNIVPSKQASFYVISNVGALMENDDQNGLAHFLEHMAFNGTKHFPDNSIIETLTKHGVVFGTQINASTSYNETVYTLKDIPLAPNRLLDTCLLILHDWAHYISMEDAIIDRERKVIIEEERTTKDVGKRLREKTLPVLLKGSKYVKHNVIGNMNIIRNFKRSTLEEFYQDWYRTDLQAIAVVGDIDVEEVEKKIIDLFSTIPAVKNPRPRPFEIIPPQKGVAYSLVTEKELPYSFISLNMLSEAVKPELKNHEYMREGLVEMLYSLMFKNRLTSLVQQRNSPCLAADSKMGPLMRGYRAYVISVTANAANEGKALEMVYRENERLKRFGFTLAELESAKSVLSASLDAVYAQREQVTSGQLMSEIQSYFLEGEPAPGLEYYYEFARTMLPAISLKDVSDKAKEWIKPANMVVSIAGGKDGIHMTKGDVMTVLRRVEKMQLEPFGGEDNVVKGELIKEPLKGGKIVAERELPQFDAREWMLDNGAKVLFRKADFEKNQVSLLAYSKGGTSLLDADMLPSAMMLNQFLPGYGLGDYSAKELGQLLLGKEVKCSVNIGSTSESVSGMAVPENFEALMQMVYLSFEKPRFDKITYELLIQQAFASIQSSRMNDSLQMILNNYNSRIQLYNSDFLKQVSFEKMEKIYRDRIQDASDFTFFIVGNVDAEKIRPLVEKYIGSIGSIRREETWKDRGVRCPQGETKKEIQLAGSEPKATEIMVYSKEMPYSIRDNFYFAVMQSILGMRCNQSLRNEAGGTYEVAVQGGAEREPYEVFNLSATFDCDPVRLEELKGLLFQEVEKMVKEGPKQEELVQVVIGIRNKEAQVKVHNAYWMNILVSFGLYGVDLTDPQNTSEIMDYVKPEDIQNFAERFFSNANLMDILFISKGE